MSIWDKIQAVVNAGNRTSVAKDACAARRDASKYAFLDAEVGVKDQRVRDIGAVRWDGAVYHGTSRRELKDFLKSVDFVCGHNIIHHDAKHLFGDEDVNWQYVDTLYLSPLLFPERPYHKLLKDEKLQTDELNNPVNDCRKAKDLLMDELEKWRQLADDKRAVFTALLEKEREFAGFIEMAEGETTLLSHHDNSWSHVAILTKNTYKGKICGNADVEGLVRQHPIELSYALALIDTTDHRSVTPGWVLRNYPQVENVVRQLRHAMTNCCERTMWR